MIPVPVVSLNLAPFSVVSLINCHSFIVHNILNFKMLIRSDVEMNDRNVVTSLKIRLLILLLKLSAKQTTSQAICGYNKDLQ